MQNYKARGIVLHTVKYGESSLIAYLLTDVGGRRTYMIQGVRSRGSKSNKAALFQPMFIVEFEGLSSPRSQMHRMKECGNYRPLSHTPFDPRKSTISLFMAEVLYRLIREEEANAPLFDFICKAVEELDRMEEGVANFHLWFLVQLSYYLGFYPGNEYSAGNIFDIQSGLFLPQAPMHGTCMGAECSELLSQLMDCEASELDSIKLGRGRRSEFMENMLSYFGYHFDSLSSARSIGILKDVF